MRPDRIRLPQSLVGSDLFASLQGSGEVEPESYEALREMFNELRTETRELKEQLQDQERTFTAFTQQFEQGRNFIQGLIYRQVLDEIITVPSGTQFRYPGLNSVVNPPTAAGFDVSQDLQHTFYKISGFVLDGDVDVLYEGGAFTIAPRTVTLGIMRTYRTSPVRLESYLSIYQNSGSNIDLHVKIYRQIGIS